MERTMPTLVTNRARATLPPPRLWRLWRMGLSSFGALVGANPRRVPMARDGGGRRRAEGRRLVAGVLLAVVAVAALVVLSSLAAERRSARQTGPDPLLSRPRATVSEPEVPVSSDLDSDGGIRSSITVTR
jgi:hypothetical protein